MVHTIARANFTMTTSYTGEISSTPIGFEMEEKMFQQKKQQLRNR